MAIELQSAMKRSLRSMIDGLSEFRGSVRWVGAEQMHLTLKFLGEVSDVQAAGVCEACQRVAHACAPSELTLDCAGCFPRDGRVRVIWGGSSRTPPALSACAARCEDTFAELGFARESRPFSAHVTIGRVRRDDTQGRLRNAVGEIRVTPAHQQADSMTLFQSVLGPRGAKYNVMGHYPFGGAG